VDDAPRLPDLEEPGYDFGGATFDLQDPGDREVVRFILSQALYGEATGVYCGRSLYAARSLEAARFYVRQAKQELAHLELFAEVFRSLDMKPARAHWLIRALSAHNDYYPLKVLMEHAIGEGMVLDIFKDLLLQTLPDADPRIPAVKKKLRVVCREEMEHVAWGEKETKRLLAERPWLRVPFHGLVEIQLAALPALVRAFRSRGAGHPVLSHVEGFLAHVRARVYAQGRRLGFVPEARPGLLGRAWAMLAGVLLLLRSQLARSRSQLPAIYLTELGFEGEGPRS
jgi:demethoxyubiquinone hydroxylase (CLK1/Coq7/Cat5 family)